MTELATEVGIDFLTTEKQFVSHFPSFYGDQLLVISKELRLPVDQINLVIVLLLTSIFAAIYRRIESCSNRQRFGTVAGIFLTWSLYGPKDMILLLLYVAVMYLAVVRSGKPWLVFGISMIGMVAPMIYIYFTAYLSWRIDLTASLLGITIRFNTLAWDLYDGNQIKKRRKLSTNPRIAERRREYGWNETVSFTQYMQYMFFFIHILIGSSLSIMEYCRLSDRSLFVEYGWTDKNNDPSPSYYDLFSAIIDIIGVSACYAIGQIYFPVSYIHTQQFTSLALPTQLIMLPTVMCFTRFKYNIGWKLLDLSVIISGAGFSRVSYDEETNEVRSITWDRARNINTLKTVFYDKSSELSQNWNMTVNDWLTHYVFYRMPYGRGIKIFLTRCVGAFIHGIYPAYYIFFFYTVLITMAISSWQSILPTHRDYPPNSIGYRTMRVIWWIPLYIFCESGFLWFMELEIKKAWKVWQTVYYIPIIVVVVLFVLGKICEQLCGTKTKPKHVRRSKRLQKKTE